MNYLHTLFSLTLLTSAFGISRQCDTTFPDGRPCDVEGITVADPDSCYHYYQCHDGCVLHMERDTGMTYDENHFACRSNDLVTCGTRPCEDPAHCDEPEDCTPPEQKIDCQQMGIGLYPDEYNCRRYWQCTVGLQAEHHLCPNDAEGNPMMFDLVYYGCNYDYLTQCQQRPICDECNENCSDVPDTTTTQHCGHELDCSNKPNGYYPDPYSCQDFWICEHGFAYHEQCQPGLMYDAELVECNWADEVDCGSRPPCDECLGEC